MTMEWRIKQRSDYSALYDVYDQDGNPIAQLKTKDVAQLIASAPELQGVVGELRSENAKLHQRLNWIAKNMEDENSMAIEIEHLQGQIDEAIAIITSEIKFKANDPDRINAFMEANQYD